MKANDILWDVRFPRELRDFPRAVNIPPEKDAAAYLTCLTGIRPKGFRLVSSETDATACPQSATALPRYGVSRGDNLPFSLLNSMQTTRPGQRVSAQMDLFDEYDEEHSFSMVLQEDAVPDDPFQAVYTLNCWDAKGNPVIGHTGTIKGFSVMETLRRDLRQSLSHLYGKDPYWLFGKAELTPVEQYLHMPETPVDLAHRMVDELEANAAQHKDTSLFTLATVPTEENHKGPIPDVRVRLLDRSNSDFPLSVEVICDIEPSFIDIRPVVGDCKVYGAAAVMDDVLDQLATMLSKRSVSFQPTGFWREADVFERLCEIQVGAHNASTFMFNSSLLFAYGLHEMLGYEVECLCEPPEYEGEPWYCRVIHAYCVKGDMLIDVRGATTDRSAFFMPWKGQMLPMRETIVLSHKAIETALNCCIPSGREQCWYKSAADFTRSFLCYYDI